MGSTEEIRGRHTALTGQLDVGKAQDAVREGDKKSLTTSGLTSDASPVGEGSS